MRQIAGTPDICFDKGVMFALLHLPDCRLPRIRERVSIPNPESNSDDAALASCS